MSIAKQRRRLHRARGHVPPLLQMAGHGGTVSRKTAKKKLTKVYWSLPKGSPKRLILLLEPKKLKEHDQKQFPRRTGAPTHFQICSGATVANPILRLNSAMPRRTEFTFFDSLSFGIELWLVTDCAQYTYMFVYSSYYRHKSRIFLYWYLLIDREFYG